MSDPRIMKSTEVTSINLDSVYPGLRVVDKFHPPGGGYSDASYESFAAIKGSKDITTDLSGGKITPY